MEARIAAERAETLVYGIGPVEAALATADVLRNGRVSALLHIGIAGARGIEPPALVIGSEAVYCDVRDPQSTMPRVDRVEPDARLLTLVVQLLPEAHVLPIGTSAKVGGGGGFRVEAMEGFGVLRAAARAGVPAIELRAISNDVEEADRSLWRFDDALAALAASVPAIVDALS